ncbi:PiggyBac transposable element-derived protein 4 [Anthophora retusa]
MKIFVSTFLCDLTDDDQSLLVEESNAEADSFSDDSEADFFANQRRKHERLIVSSEDEDTEDIDVLAGGDAASCSRVTTDNERTIDDDDTWYDNKENLFEFAFDDSKCGIQSNVDKYSSARDIFEQLFSRNIVETLVRCTNNYGKNLFETMRPVTRNASTFNFIETDEEELLKFLGLCLLQGQKKAPSIRHLFTDNPLYYTPIFSYTMSGRRFQQLLRCINGHYTGHVDSSTEKLKKIYPILQPILANFQAAYLPSKTLSLDESLLLFRGRLSFRQYIKGKKAKYGIKLFQLTTPDGYVLNVEIYQGKSDDIDKTPKTSSLVLRLMQQYLNKGHHLFMDNFYNSIELSKKLLEHKTHTTGTLRSNRKGNPEEVTSKKLNKGEHIWRRQGQIYVSKWRDKREVLSITTNHHPEIVEVTNKFGQKNKKPNDLAEYNLNMSGVDRCDQMVSYYSSPRKSIRWYKKLLFHLLDLCVWNSYFIYRQFHKSTTFLQFRDLLIQSLIALPDTEISGKSLAALTPIRGRPRQINSSPMASTSSTQQHFLEKIPLPVDFQRKTYFLRCRQCSANQIRKETSYRCKTCPKKPPLCPECFESYHL